MRKWRVASPTASRPGSDSVDCRRRCHRSLRFESATLATSKMTSSSTGIPRGRLATPITRSNRHLVGAKDIAKEIRDPVRDPGCSKKSPEVAMNTPSRTTRVTLSSEPSALWPQPARLKPQCGRHRVPPRRPAPFPAGRDTSACGPRPGAFRSGRANCLSAAPPRMCRTASARRGAECPAPATGCSAPPGLRTCALTICLCAHRRPRAAPPR